MIAGYGVRNPQGQFMNCPYRMSWIIRSRKMSMVDLLKGFDCVRADTPGVYHGSILVSTGAREEPLLRQRLSSRRQSSGRPTAAADFVVLMATNMEPKRGHLKEPPDGHLMACAHASP
jgi:hypothetical protein